MGLDMYLRAQKYVSGFRFQRKEGDPEINEFDRLVELFGMGEHIAADSPAAYVEFTIGYWRKANHIHEWFVQNVQGGVDECQEAHVSKDQLLALRSACEMVLGVREKVGVNVKAANRTAKETLPTQEGFFFGSTEYDEWYWQDTERTVEIIDKALALLEGEGYWSIIYQSSW